VGGKIHFLLHVKGCPFFSLKLSGGRIVRRGKVTVCVISTEDTKGNGSGSRRFWQMCLLGGGGGKSCLKNGEKKGLLKCRNFVYKGKSEVLKTGGGKFNR